MTLILVWLLGMAVEAWHYNVYVSFLGKTNIHANTIRGLQRLYKAQTRYRVFKSDTFKSGEITICAWNLCYSAPHNYMYIICFLVCIVLILYSQYQHDQCQ